jgi:transcriptional regulator with XRE-family HTH domain
MGHKQYNVGALAAELCGDPEVEARVNAQAEKHRLIDSLISARIDAGVSQSGLARRIGCNPSKISRLESGWDAQLSIGDLVAYCLNLDMGVGIILDPKPKCKADRIKECVTQAHKLLGELSDLAEDTDDRGIAMAIHEFQAKVLFDLLEKSSEYASRIISHINLLPEESQAEETEASQEAETAELAAACD